MTNKLNELQSKISNAEKRQADIVAADLQNAAQLSAKQAQLTQMIVDGKDTSKIESEISALRVQAENNLSMLENLAAALQSLRGEFERETRSLRLAEAMQKKRKVFERLNKLHASFAAFKSEKEAIQADLNEYSNMLSGTGRTHDYQVMNAVSALNSFDGAIGVTLNHFPAGMFAHCDEPTEF